MNEFVIIFLGIFILILFIILFVLLYYLNDNYSRYNEEVKDNLYKSEQVINDTSRAFNRLQDNVINKIAKVNSNQDVIINSNSNASGRISTNLLNIMDVTNNGVQLSNLTSNIIDPSKSLQIKLKPEIITYSNISVLTGSNYVNICDNAVNASNRKCLNINVDGTGTFNINTSNNVSASNIANISIRDASNKVMAVFDGVNKKISLGSNIAPAIEILNNVYTPDLITCQYQYINSGDLRHISFTFISNFNIKASTFINLTIFEPYITNIGKSTTDYTTGSFDINSFIIKMKPIIDIPKNTIKSWNIPVTYNDTNINMANLIQNPIRTTAYITLS